MSYLIFLSFSGLSLDLNIHLVRSGDAHPAGQPYSGNQRLDVFRMGEVVGLDDRRILDVPRIESDAAAALRMN